MDRTLLSLVLALIVALIVFALWPGLDLATAHFFYDRGGFIGGESVAKAGRWAFRVTPYLLMIGLVLAWVLSRLGVKVPFAPSGRGVLFLIATMAIGPGLIVNLGMKDHLHRPRPVHVQEFGGDAPFKPWYEFDGACAKNCGFASGEAAQGFWMVAPALLAPPPWRGAAVTGAVVFGAATSVLRLAFGGHFLSDVVIGGLIALIVVVGLRRALWPREGP